MSEPRKPARMERAVEPRETDRDYRGELAELRERLLLMGAKVEDMLAGSFRAFARRDAEAAHATIALDHEVDALEIVIDAQCLRVLALYKPVASDLRFITTVLKLVTYLERIGDLAELACRHALALSKAEPLPYGPSVQRLMETATEMVRSALDAVVERDVHRAQNVIERDRAVDAYYAQCFPELMEIMMSTPQHLAAASRLQDVCKAFERVGDQAVSIAEMVPFLVEGVTVRHPALREHSSSGIYPLRRRS
jgi:phosphate transport system protein